MAFQFHSLVFERPGAAGHGYGLFDAPPTKDSRPKSDNILPKFAGQLADRNPSAKVFNVNSVGFIVCLLGPCGPSTVFWSVVAIYVNAVNGMFGRRLVSHVSDEVLKSPPTAAHGYPPASVVAITSNIGLIAAVQHRPPRHIFWGFLSTPAAVSVLRDCRRHSLPLSAPATLGHAGPYGIRISHSLVPARALASPHALADILHDREMIEGFSSDIHESSNVLFHANTIAKHLRPTAAPWGWN